MTKIEHAKIPHDEPSTVGGYDAIAKAMIANARTTTRVCGHTAVGSKLCGHLRDTEEMIKAILGVEKIGPLRDLDLPVEIYPRIAEARTLYGAFITHSGHPKVEPLGDIAE